MDDLNIRKKKMALLYMSNYEDWPLGGMLTYVNNILPYLCEHYKIDIYGCSVDNIISNPIIINDKKYNVIHYTNIKKKHKLLPNFFFSFINLLKYKRKLKEYDVIFSHTSATTLATYICRTKAYIVHQQHGLSYKDVRGYRKILNIGYSLAQIVSDINLIVANEKEVRGHARKMKKFTDSQFLSVKSPINLSGLQDCIESQRDLMRFIYTGRIDNWKNIELLVDAFDFYLKENGRKDQLFIIGDGPIMESIKKKIKDLGREGLIHVLGYMNHEEIMKQLLKSSVFLFPSKGEGVSLSVLEAFSAGLPVVAFDVKGMNELVVDNYNGFLIKNQTIKDFAKGINNIYPVAESLRKNCYECVKEYDSSLIAERIINIIDENYH